MLYICCTKRRIIQAEQGILSSAIYKFIKVFKASIVVCHVLIVAVQRKDIKVLLYKVPIVRDEDIPLHRSDFLIGEGRVIFQFCECLLLITHHV